VLATNRNGIAYIKITNTRETDEIITIPSVTLEEYEILNNPIDEPKSHNSKKKSFNEINAITTVANDRHDRRTISVLLSVGTFLKQRIVEIPPKVIKGLMVSIGLLSVNN